MVMVRDHLDSFCEPHTNRNTDCVSFKSNTTDIVVQNLLCNGSHGISVGSLGQYKNEVDIVQNVLVYNTSMLNASVCRVISMAVIGILGN